MRIFFTLLLLLSASLYGVEAWGQLSITSAGVPYSQDFNSLPVIGTGFNPSGGIFSSGWSFLETDINANSTYSADNGSSTTGETYSYGSTSSTDRAFGMLQSTNLSSILGFKFTNNTGTTITSFTIWYAGEVWRQNVAGDSLVFNYQLNNAALNATGWTNVPALQFYTPVTGTPGPIDGNVSGNRVVIGPVTISKSIPNGTTVTFRWRDPSQASSAGMGIDDFTIIANTNTASTTPPAISPASTATVDAPFDITFTPNSSFEGAITGIVVNGTPLTSGYSISSGKITFTPSASNPSSVLQTAGAKIISVIANGYTVATVNQTINPGVPASISVVTQPAAPATYSGTLTTQPVVSLKDQYGNNAVGYTVTAAVTAGQGSGWSLGGTTNITTNSSGNAVFTNLTATNNSSAPYSASITFSYGSVSVISSSFVIPAAAPVLNAAANATVDNSFAVTFTDNASWRAAITSITVNGSALPSAAYSTTTTGQIIFTPSASALLQSPGTKTIDVAATGYNNTSVSQTISAGAPFTFTFNTQPGAPATYNGLLNPQPVLTALDQYGNKVTGTYTINAAITAGQGGSWTLGGTTSAVVSSTGVVTYTSLTATNLTASPYTASITFSYGSVSIISKSFIIPAPPPANDDCVNAVTLTPSASPTPVAGSLYSATPTPGLTTDAGQNDVWYKFTAPCTGLDSVVVNFTAGTKVDIDFEVFANSCPTSGTGLYISVSNSSNIEFRKSNYTGSTIYYIRVIDNGQNTAGNFTISVFTRPPNQPSAITGGSATPCYGNTETYSVTPILGVTYNWTLPGSDWTGSSTSNTITTVVGSSAGNITVTPSTSCGLSGPSQTLAVVPVTAPSDVSGASANPSNGRVTVSWTNPLDCFDEIMVVATDNPNVTLVPTGDGSQYVASAVYASAVPDNSVNMNPGEYCIYKGNSTSVTITSLLNSNVYKVKIFVRWGTMWSPGVQVTATPVVASTGAFRSKASGNWTDGTIWEKYNGTGWVPTAGVTDFPNYYTSDVSIEPNNTVVLNNDLMVVHNLDIQPTAKLWVGSQYVKNKYIVVFGNITCDGTIGNSNPNTADDICFSMEGSSGTISGAGNFGCQRLVKRFDSNEPGGSNNTNLNINMNINLFWNGTTMFNYTTQTSSNTNFNVVLNSPYKLACKNPLGSIAIDGQDGNGFYNNGGKFTINGTLDIPGGFLYLTTNNNLPGPKCEFEIGTTGTVNAAIVRFDASGTATHVFTIKNGGLLNITDPTGIAIYQQVNNTVQLNAGSTVQYSGITGQQVLSGLTYSNLTLSSPGEKIISTFYTIITVNNKLDIKSGSSLNLNGRTLVLNGTVTGTGTITGSRISNITIGPNSTLTGTPLGVLRFTPGRDSLNSLILDRMMKADVYPNSKFWAAVLGTNLNVSSLQLKQGILATDNHLLTLLNYNPGDFSTYNKASYIATTDTLATPFTVGNTFNGSYGLRINGVKANTDTYFPVGADFISPNRAMVNLGSAPTRDMTVVLTKGDIGYTGAPRVNRIWYMFSSVNDIISASMRLYYTGYDLATYPYQTKQDELETGFTGTNVRLLEKANQSDHFFTNISNNSDILFNGSPNTEVYAKYTTASTAYNGSHTGIFQFGVFSIVDSGNVVLPVVFTDVRAYQHSTGISINWSVANETGIDHYEVERAGDGRLFSAIQLQSAYNSGMAGNTYTVADAQPLKGTNYYRVKAVGKDGQVMYSTVVNVTLSSDGRTSLVVYPNPIKNNQCNVQLTNLPAGKYNLSIYNTVGQLIALKQVALANSGSITQKMYLPAGTAAGLYIVKLTGQDVNMQMGVFVSGK